MLISIPSNDSMVDKLSVAISKTCVESSSSGCVADDSSLQKDRASPTDVKYELDHVTAPPAPEKTMQLPQFNPFFIMDWLEKVDPIAMEQAQQILQTPQKKSGYSKASLVPLKKELFTPKVSTVSSPIMKQSIAIGNGYNAKGIQKARHGAWEAALSCWEDALEIRSQVLGETHVDVANTCNNIGIALGKLHRANDAVSYLQRALEIRKLNHGERHEQVAATLHNLGNVFQQDGDLESAIRFFCECKLLQEQILGPDHAEVARACIAIGHTYYQADALEDSREAYVDALATFYRVGARDGDAEVEALLDDIHDLDRKIVCALCPM